MESPRRPPRRAHSPAVYRRRRLVVGLVAITIVAVPVLLLSGGSSHRGGGPTKTAKAANAANAAQGPLHLVVSTAKWELPQPLSRAVALPAGGAIDVLGGLTGTGNATTGVIMRIDRATGAEQQVGTLPAPVHDAAGAILGQKELVFGGGAGSVTSSVQTFSRTAGSGGPSPAVAGQLPAPRADLAAAAAPDHSVYLAGGFDGTNLSPDVLRTKDGTSFASVGQLPVPVRYPAMAAAGGKVWVIGGESASGAATTDIQTVDGSRHLLTIAGHLPIPLAHASAAVIDGTVYVFGGRSGGNVVDTVWSIDPITDAVTQAGALPLPTSDMSVVQFGATAYLMGGEGQLAQPGRTVMIAGMVHGTALPAPAATAAPFTGKMLIADRGNDRLILLTAGKQILWAFPSARYPAPAQGFYFPDDAFFARRGTAIITNQEDQDTILELAYPSGRVIASYGHPNVPGSAPGYLNQPDDAYLLADGRVTVADAKNCRILFLNPDFTYASAIGHAGLCHHDIPNDVAYPNGDTPLADGNFLVSEIYGSYVDEVTSAGQVVWTLKLPIAYPSDPQQLGPDLYLVADYSSPGGIYEFTREGQIVWSYQVPSGEGMLDHPSLSERLPNGLICANDDYRHRVVCINPANSQIVWQYGQTGHAGTGYGQLNTPDGFDLLAPDGSTPTHPTTG